MFAHQLLERKDREMAEKSEQRLFGKLIRIGSVWLHPDEIDVVEPASNSEEALIVTLSSGKRLEVEAEEFQKAMEEWLRKSTGPQSIASPRSEPQSSQVQAPKVIPLSGSNEPPLIRRISDVELVVNDPQLGDCIGELPYSPVVNRETIVITISPGGPELAKGDKDGQIKGSDKISGIVHLNGTYRLVFRDAAIQRAYISYDARS